MFIGGGVQTSKPLTRCVVTCPHKTGPFQRRVCSRNVQSDKENRRCANHFFPEDQIVGILQEYAAGAKVSELCRKQGMSDATLYKWKAKYGGMTVSELRRLKDLEAETAELKRLLADAMLDNAGLKGLLAKSS